MSKVSVPFFRTPYNFDTEAWSNECSVKEFGPSMTIQSHAEDADLNVLMKRFGVTGKMPDDVRPVFYGDFEDVFDFRSALHAIRDAEQMFMRMPADLRARFLNDPQRFVEFCSASSDGVHLDNLDEMRKLGLAVSKVESINGGREVGITGAGEASGGAAGAAGGRPAADGAAAGGSPGAAK